MSRSLNTQPRPHRPIVAPPPRPKNTEPLIVDRQMLRELANAYVYGRAFDGTISPFAVERIANQILIAVDCDEPLALKHDRV